MIKTVDLNKLEFNFPSNNNGEVRGISDPGIESFSGAPIKGLGREIVQNSLDANKLMDGPARVDFQMFTLPFRELPGSKSLKDSFQRGLQFFSSQKSEKARNFYKNALEMMDEPIQVLRISDFNTTGLIGSKGSHNTPWVDLTKASGVSDKAVGSMGSFGIGKYASFAASSFRTVFYNTVDIEGIQAFQGISRITTFQREDNEHTQGIGYLGQDNNMPLHRNISLDPQYTRTLDEPGTDIYIVGFRNIENSWEESIISAVLDGFLYAIYNESLDVRVGTVKINKEKLSEIIEKYSEFLTEGAKNYYRVLTDSNSMYTEINYRNDGLIRFWILLEDNLNNKAAFFRGAGMKIKDRPFNNPLINGSAVLMIEGERIQNNIVPLENPQHTNWEPQRASNTPWARNYIQGIYDIVKDKLVELTNSGDTLEIDSDVGEFLPLISDENEIEAKEETISDDVKNIEKKEVIKKVTRNEDLVNPSDNDGSLGEPGTDIDDGPGSAGHRQSDTPIINPGGSGDNTPGNGYGSSTFEKKITKEIKISEMRVVVLNKDEGRYSISFIPEIDSDEIELEVNLIGESLSMNVEVQEAFMPLKKLTILNNKITGFSVKKNQLVRLMIKIDFQDYAALEVRVNGR